jgi:SAM-dependent methyltransferase
VTPSVVHQESCRICGSRDLELVLAMTPTPPGDHYVTAAAMNEPQPSYPLDLVMCGECGLAQLGDVVDPELLYRNYIYNTAISLGLVQHFDRYADAVIAGAETPPGSLMIDIGSNDGTLLRAFANRGLRVLGVDPAREVAAKATQAGLETIPRFFSSALAAELRRERGQASIVTANNVFANIDDIDDLVEGIRELLAPDGVFVFETGYFPDLVGDRIIDNIYHEHLSYYSVKPLLRLFPRHGMELVAVEHEPSKGGSIRGFVQLAGRRNGTAGAGVLHELVEQETRDKSDRPEALRAFAEDVERLRSELIALVAGLRAEGRTVAGYGASVGVTTLLYHFDMSKALEFVVDDNPVRHDRFTPGQHIRVLPSDALYDHKPDDVLLLAWRYAAPIMRKHEAYRQAGGRFILPLPAVSIK